MYQPEAFPQHSNEEKNESTPQDFNEEESRYTNAKEIAKEGNFLKIKNRLEEENFFNIAIEKTTLKHQEVLSRIDFLTEQDLEIFTILDLYDEDLALHSLETYRIAKEKIERKLAFDIVLIDLFEKEGVSGEQFLRSCLLHDIGKIEIPNFIMNNEINNSEMDLILRDLVVDESNTEINDKLKSITKERLEAISEEDLRKILKDNNLRSVHLVPVKHILNKDELETLTKRGVDINQTIMDIIKSHEGYSRTILEQSNLPIESELVGSHHNYHGRGSNYPLTIDALHLTVDMVELIRIADITEALTASRSYNKQGFSLPKVLKIILEEVEAGKISPKIAYLWIDDEVQKIENQRRNLTEEDNSNLEFVKNKLKVILSEIENTTKYPKAA